MLRFRLRTEDEIYKRLRKKGFSLAVVKKVVNYLKDNNYLDDKEFMRAYLGTALVKGWGPVKVNFNLKKIGICARLRQEAVRKSEKKSSELIKKLLAEKVCCLKKEKPKLKAKKIKAKLVRFLARRGFYYKDIYKYLDLFIKENENE